MTGLRRDAGHSALECHAELQRVVLFGSLARGDYGLYSGADLLLVLGNSRFARYFDRIPEFVDDFLPAPVPVELFPYTTEELDRMVRDENLFITQMLREGQVLAERG